MAHYTFSINNQSGEPASYGIFSEAPTIDPPPFKVQTRIISAVHAVPSPHGQATIMLPKGYYATCGVYDIDSEPDDPNAVQGRATTGTEVIDNRTVQLTSPVNATVKSVGSSLWVDCKTGTPRFSEKPAGDLSPAVIANPGCFAVRTSSDFTSTKAKSNKFFLGYTSSLRHSIGPHAMFTPLPEQTYNIKPSTTFYVAVRDAEPRDPVDPALLGKPTCKVDFAALARDHVLLIHRDNGTLTVNAVSDESEPPVFARVLDLSVNGASVASENEEQEQEQEPASES
ncbi:hypothetical protein QBC38DRAFT_469939 [Podospora fimiseda]|uniref:Uncharacterized protein n=1 Tax=Podospora fimiseda TaxID=252190 RepID=A0AAN7BV88_9PEZI|nr:hypothetical protein QBC38DRAFT_469939 [Podospora fimiseda]